VDGGGIPGRRGLLAGVARWAVIASVGSFLAFPFYWMAVSAFKRSSDLYDTTLDPLLFHQRPTLAHWRFLFQQTLFPRWFLNTTLVGLAVVAITLALALPAAYALARLLGAWGERLGIAMFLTYLVPPTLLFLPMSRVVARLGLQDSLFSLVVVYPTFTVPFATWLLMGFLKTIPRDVEDAARVDGLTRFQAFLRVVVPISYSGVLTAATFSFTLVLQDFVYALTFISSASRQTVSVGVPIYLVRGDVYYWGSLMAASLVTSLPVAIVYELFLDRFVSGFTMGAVK
jgi:multiple sugar transport system permease protein